jgi:F0F1-type ATP synthase epsilon subunit
MQVNILEPKGIIWKGRSKEVILPVEDGEVCILDFHQPFLIRLRKGDVRFSVFGSRLSVLAEHRAPSTEHRVPIQDGIAFMRSNELTVFVEN